MMKRKPLSLALLLALLTLSLTALAQANQPTTLQGLILEVGDGYFLLADETRGTVRVNLDDPLTVYEGTVTRGTLAADQYVYVQYNGAMTRSLPPQVTALKISCFQISGTVSDILANGYVIEGDAVFNTVIVHMGEGFPPVFRGVPVTVYYNGILAMSMPPQLNAVHIVVPSLAGMVSGLTDQGFTLTEQGGQTHAVTLTGETAMQTLPADGEPVIVYYNGELAENGSVTALSVASPVTASTQPGMAQE